MAAQTEFKGTAEEGRELISALAAHCTCTFAPNNMRLSTCPVHEALAHDQRFCDGLLWYRHLRTALLSEEGQETV